MSLIARFAEYAAAFEKAFENDDWSVIAPFFTEDAVYETISAPPLAGRHEGRDAVLAAFKTSLDQFDRRFDVRELEPAEGPEERDGNVWMRWRATYRLDGAPPFVLEGTETARFKGDRICHLEDRIPEELVAELGPYLAEHGAKLRTPGA